jgi:hypothetical protein
VQGGGDHDVPAPLDELPLFARAGTVLALLPPDVDTLTGYGTSDVVNLDDRSGRLHLIVFPRGRTSARIPGGRVFSRDARGGWRLSVRGGRSIRRIDLQASLATLRRPVHVCGVTLNGKPLRRARWSYERASRVLRARFSARGPARLVARTRCGARRP